MKRKLIAVIGLGYVGLPLATEFGKIRETLGFDLNIERISQLKNFHDKTGEVLKSELKKATKLSFTSNLNEISKASIFIITVPTPIKKNNKPDLRPLISASKMIGSIIKNGDIIIYESTVYPGATEEQAVPILEKYSKLKYNTDFFVGYSPERINPGDKKHRLTSIKKVTSGSNKKTAIEVDNLYKEIITVGTYVAESIKIAEAAKVIENTQRDLNIAFINELSIIFNKMNISTESVLKAAETKWNFLSFRPGLVGGHCIGVDPYYLTYKSELLGYKPKVILSGRTINDNMPLYVGDQIITLMKNKKIKVDKSNILILGITFKENCPDIRNSKVIDLYKYLSGFNCNIDVYDPIADLFDVKEEYKIDLINKIKKNKYDCCILAVSHDEIKNMGIKKIKSFMKIKSVIFDIKQILPASLTDGRL